MWTLKFNRIDPDQGSRRVMETVSFCLKRRQTCWGLEVGYSCSLEQNQKRRCLYSNTKSCRTQIIHQASSAITWFFKRYMYLFVVLLEILKADSKNLRCLSMLFKIQFSILPSFINHEKSQWWSH